MSIQATGVWLIRPATDRLTDNKGGVSLCVLYKDRPYWQVLTGEEAQGCVQDKQQGLSGAWSSCIHHETTGLITLPSDSLLEIPIPTHHCVLYNRVGLSSLIQRHYKPLYLFMYKSLIGLSPQVRRLLDHRFILNLGNLPPVSVHKTHGIISLTAPWYWFPGSGPFSVEFAYSPGVWMDSLWVLQLAPTVQRHAS